MYSHKDLSTNDKTVMGATKTVQKPPHQSCQPLSSNHTHTHKYTPYASDRNINFSKKCKSGAPFVRNEPHPTHRKSARYSFYLVRKSAKFAQKHCFHGFVVRKTTSRWKDTFLASELGHLRKRNSFGSGVNLSFVRIFFRSCIYFSKFQMKSCYETRYAQYLRSLP